MIPSITISGSTLLPNGTLPLRPVTVLADQHCTEQASLLDLIHGIYQFPFLNRQQDLSGFPEQPQVWMEALADGQPVSLTRRDLSAVKEAVSGCAEYFNRALLNSLNLLGQEGLFKEGHRHGTVCLAGQQMRLEMPILQQTAPKMKVSFPSEVRWHLSEERGRALMRVLYDRKTGNKGGKPWHRTDDAGMVFEASRDMLGLLPRDSHYLPSGRNYMLRNYPLLISSMLRHGHERDRREGGSIFTAADGDYLAELHSMLAYRDQADSSSDFTRLAEQLETELLQAEIIVQESAAGIGMPSFFYRPSRSRKHYPIRMASDLIAGTAPLVLYLKYIAAPGKAVSIANPELWTPPDTQPQLAEILWETAQLGVKVMLSTGSEAFTYGLNASVRSPVKTPDQTGIWQITPADPDRPNGKTVLREAAQN